MWWRLQEWDKAARCTRMLIVLAHQELMDHTVVEGLFEDGLQGLLQAERAEGDVMALSSDSCVVLDE